MTTILLWDIDGTLLTTARAGIFAVQDAVEAVTGEQPDLSDLHTSGMTDAEVMLAALEHATGSVDGADVGRMLAVYEEALPRRLPARQGHLMPNVAAILAALRDRADALSLLVTGNTAAGARAKLEHYGIWEHFAGGCFCSEGVRNRDEIAAGAAAVAREHGADGGAQTFLIGDTPQDVRAGHSIGARTIAVATGSHALEELERCGPWVALERLPEPGGFLRLVELS